MIKKYEGGKLVEVKLHRWEQYELAKRNNEMLARQTLKKQVKETNTDD